jgi:acyl-ACP thioesterase
VLVSATGLLLTEIVPDPRRGRAFEREMRPGIADANGEGRCRLDAIARWLQDIAYADIVDAGLEDRGAWIMRKTRIKVETFPQFGEDLRLRTFCSGIGRFSAERRTSIRGEDAAVEAVAVWIYLERETAWPTRFPDDFAGIFEESAGDRDASVRRRHPKPPAGAERSGWVFRAAEVDPAGHINNSAYWVPLEEELAAAPDPRSIDAEIEYREPAQPGEVELLRNGSSYWVASLEGSVHASLLRA